MRALMGGGKIALVANLLGDNGPEETIRTIAREQAAGSVNFNGLHFFAFGGFLKTSKFVAAIQQGNITLDSADRKHNPPLPPVRGAAAQSAGAQ